MSQRAEYSAGSDQLLTPPLLKLSHVNVGTDPTVGGLRKLTCFQDFEELGVRVLVVEDDPLIREFVVEALQDEGFDVIHAGDGEEALAWCNQRAADVLVTDIKLPGKIDGWQIAELCREHTPDLPVIYATGFSPVDPRPVAGSLCLHKPYHPEEIVRAVRQMTERPSA